MTGRGKVVQDKKLLTHLGYVKGGELVHVFELTKNFRLAETLKRKGCVSEPKTASLTVTIEFGNGITRPLEPIPRKCSKSPCLARLLSSPPEALPTPPRPPPVSMRPKHAKSGRAIPFGADPPEAVPVAAALTEVTPLGDLLLIIDPSDLAVQNRADFERSVDLPFSFMPDASCTNDPWDKLLDPSLSPHCFEF
jgi:hypothetical protein